jgi:hypothetical protein
MNTTIVWDVTSCSLAEITEASGKHVVSVFGQEGIVGQKCFPPRYFFATAINFYRTTRRHIPKDNKLHCKPNSQFRIGDILLRASTPEKHP